MTREETKQEILQLKGRNFIFELATGTGKSWLAIEKMKQLYDPINSVNILVVVPRNVLKKNWEIEFNKWWPDCNLIISYTTYASLDKYEYNHYSFVVWDECHHLSDRCMKIVDKMSMKYNILCSATIPRDKMLSIKQHFHNPSIYKKNLREIISSNILPDPEVILIPLPLDNYFKREKAHYKGGDVDCTETYYYKYLSNQIDYYKNLYMSSYKEWAKNKWLQLCGKRLKWLSDIKLCYTKKIIESLHDRRTITFCNTIEQTEKLGKYCINSKNKNAIEYLNQFNDGTINHITCCDMINEGINISNCEVGIFNSLNSSEILTTQKQGRLLRGEHPMFIIPYHEGTREEELLPKILENCKPELIRTVQFYEI